MAAPVLASSDWTAPVGALQSYYSNSACFYFTLDGISNADPALGTGSPWFAMERDTAGRVRDAYAMLLTAKATGAAVRVRTTGGSICGYAQVQDIIMP
jgi:hypothetical protein